MARWVGLLVSAIFFQCSAASKPWVSMSARRHLRSEAPILPSSEECRVDRATFRAVQHPELAIDVTNGINRLIAHFGVHNITGGTRLLITYVGDPAVHMEKELVIVKNGITTVIHARELWGHAVNIKKALQLTNESLGYNMNCKEIQDEFHPVVDMAVFRSPTYPEPSNWTDVTEVVNGLLALNGIFNLTGGKFLGNIVGKRGDPLPLQPKMLQVMRGPLTLEIYENAYPAYDLSPLFVNEFQPLLKLEDSALEGGWLKRHHKEMSKNALTVDYADLRSLEDPNDVVDYTEAVNKAVAANGLASMNLINGTYPSPLWEILGDTEPAEAKFLRVTRGHVIVDMPEVPPWVDLENFDLVYNLAALAILPEFVSTPSRKLPCPDHVRGPLLEKEAASA